jgi:DNA polymerase-3 subunit epsilon
MQVRTPVASVEPSCDARSTSKREPQSHSVVPTTEGKVRHLGTTQITQGNIDNNHIYLRGFFDEFPIEAIGGSNQANAAFSKIFVEWGGTAPVMTDLDGQKKFFRKRGWIRDFFEQNNVVAGSVVSVDQLGHLRYRISLVES